MKNIVLKTITCVAVMVFVLTYSAMYEDTFATVACLSSLAWLVCFGCANKQLIDDRF